MKLVKPIIFLLVLKLLKHGFAVCSNDNFKYQDMVPTLQSVDPGDMIYMYVHEDEKL